MEVVVAVTVVLLCCCSGSYALFDRSEDPLAELYFKDSVSNSATPQPQPQHPLMVPLTLLPASANATGAVCLDGTLPGYHLHLGTGSGANRWIVHLEGGGWCNTIKSCVFRQTTRRGSSKFMEKKLAFTGILSGNATENPDFHSWNRVKVRYCDGASFRGEGEDESKKLYFRGQRIWLAVIQELMSKGMKNATQALLSGCSAGGLASILHCDEFHGSFPNRTTVKCLSDAGFFLDAIDVSGGHTLRNLYQGVVELQGVGTNLPKACTDRLDNTSCFFPQNLVASVKTPLFLLNAAYDAWQVQASLAPSSADPRGSWKSCTSKHASCNASQIQFLQDFRVQMLKTTRVMAKSTQNGLFLNSCFAHCQSERQDTWFSDDSPCIKNKKIALAVGDWYFGRGSSNSTKAIDCAYPCDNTCHDMI